VTLSVALALVLAGLPAGYGLRWLHEAHQRRQRERVLRALGGALPDWEVDARALEHKAHECTLHGNIYGAADMHRAADTTRARGRKRDREWA